MNVLNSVVVIGFESYITPMCNIVIDLKNLEDKLFILDKVLPI